jgi:LuxR family maltose regulon positive regulatory protein
LVNEIAAIPQPFILLLDDYHLVDAPTVDQILTFLLDHLLPPLHLVIATREDPQLPLARLRARDQLTELRADDLRFTPAEAGGFLNQAMGLTLSADDIAALDMRTEGWIAGLQLAAISMQGHEDTTGFVRSFTGSHHFVMDYLVEEVLQQQPASIQAFLLRTAILDRLCGPLCAAVLDDPVAGGQATLEYLEHANLFLIPLDNERRWYRYHHLFADLLRQRLPQALDTARGESVTALHRRASQWFEDQGLDIEAFHHAVAANDVPRAIRLVESKAFPMHFPAVVTAILHWLESLPPAVMNARPSLWSRYAGLLLVSGFTTGVQEKLQVAEDALQGRAADDEVRHAIGQIATARATLALTRYDAEGMLAQSRRALENLAPTNLSSRANAYWTLAFGYLVQGDREAGRQALMESIAISQAGRSIFTLILATISLADVQEVDNQLHQAAATHRSILQLAGDQPLQILHESHLGLARIFYEWNDLAAAEPHARKALALARQYEKVIDRFIICELFLARLRLAQGDVAGAAAILAQTNQSAHQPPFLHRLPEVAAAQVITLLRQGNVAAAAQLVETYDLPLSRARVHLAQGDPAAALALREPARRLAEARNWPDERLKAVILQTLAFQAHHEHAQALHVLGEALALAEPGGFIRSVLDERPAMAQLLAEAATRHVLPAYTSKLVAAFVTETSPGPAESPARPAPAAPGLVEPLSQRELEVLHLIAQGLSNRDIGERLFLALDTVKGHNQKIFGKLQVQRRTEAVARARELGLL